MMYTYSFNIFLTGYPEIKFASVVLRAKKASKNYKEILITDYYDDGSEQKYTSLDELFQKNKDITPDECIFYPLPTRSDLYRAGIIKDYVPDEPWQNGMVEFFQENKDISHATCFFYWLLDENQIRHYPWGTFFSPKALYWRLVQPEIWSEIWYNCTMETDDPNFDRNPSKNNDEDDDEGEDHEIGGPLFMRRQIVY